MLYTALFNHVLVRLEAERAHRLGLGLLRLTLCVAPAQRAAARLLAPRDPRLRVRALGHEFATPLGVAAGFDKDASAHRQLVALGFAFVEAGTITARPQAGNPSPRVFRLHGQAALANRMGFPSPGAAAVAARLTRRRSRGPLGINVGRSRAAEPEAAAGDYVAAVRVLARHADYIVLNVSSPNTPGLRDLQDDTPLTELVVAVRAELARQRLCVPLLLKIAPDLSDDRIDVLADTAVRLRLDGIVAVNTTVADAQDLGGISGRPLKHRALEVIARLHARCGDALTLVAAGGIETPEDAWERIRAGATLVQAYTGFVYGGPLWPRRMNVGLARLAAAAGYRSVGDAIGSAVAPAAVAA